MSEENPTRTLLNALGQIIAVVMIIRYTLLIVHNYYPFLPTEGVVPEILKYIDLYAPMALMICVGLSAVWGKSDILKLVFLLVCAAIVIFTFFPDVRDTITGSIGITKPSEGTEEKTPTPDPAPETASYKLVLPEEANVYYVEA